MLTIQTYFNIKVYNILHQSAPSLIKTQFQSLYP